MKVAPKTLKIMAVAGTLTISGGAWYAAEQAIAYDMAQRSGEGQMPREPSTLDKLEQGISEVWHWVEAETGLIRPPADPCGACGLG